MNQELGNEPASSLPACGAQQPGQAIEVASARLAWARRRLSLAELTGDLCQARYAGAAVASITAELAGLADGASR